MIFLLSKKDQINWMSCVLKTWNAFAQKKFSRWRLNKSPHEMLFYALKSPLFENYSKHVDRQ